mmetsp:Transcript_47890/g.138535  ORF Transcript_47890/g.138535 Transcript_47890/m.138535 type:complete len:462 (-) Transcript_47890:349-1734(-)
MQAVSVLTPQHWQLLVLGAAHGSRSAARTLERVLDIFRPALIFLELDRQDFALLSSSVSTPGPEQPHLARYAAHAAPECAGALRWAQARADVAEAAEGHAAQWHTRRCEVIAVDRDQLTTRRRLAFKIAQQPLQLLSARRYWGSAPTGDGSVSEWVEHLRRDCPALHEVVLEERNQFMAYQILMHLDARLHRSYPKLPSDLEHAEAEDDWAGSCLKRVGGIQMARTRDALQWVLDGPPCGSGGIWMRPEWLNSLNRPAEPPSSERVLVICGPAHVDGLSAHLTSCLGDGSGACASAQHFLARNAATLPRLLANHDWPWARSEDHAAQDREFLLKQAAQLAVQDASSAHADGGVAGMETCQSGMLSKFLARGFGPLTLLAERGWQWLAGQQEDRLHCEPSRAGVSVAVGPVFVHERLRDLSRRPLPVWPAFITIYIACPLLLFIVIPAHIDIYWLHAKLRSA